MSSTPVAERMRAYRKRRRQGLRYVRILLHESEIDSLIRVGVLKDEQRCEPEWLQTAVLALVYRALDRVQ
jgi:hypothetical protein